MIQVPESIKTNSFKWFCKGELSDYTEIETSVKRFCYPGQIIAQNEFTVVLRQGSVIKIIQPFSSNSYFYSVTLVDPELFGIHVILGKELVFEDKNSGFRDCYDIVYKNSDYVITESFNNEDQCFEYYLIHKLSSVKAFFTYFAIRATTFSIENNLAGIRNATHSATKMLPDVDPDLFKIGSIHLTFGLNTVLHKSCSKLSHIAALLTSCKEKKIPKWIGIRIASIAWEV